MVVGWLQHQMTVRLSCGPMGTMRGLQLPSPRGTPQTFSVSSFSLRQETRRLSLELWTRRSAYIRWRRCPAYACHLGRLGHAQRHGGILTPLKCTWLPPILASFRATRAVSSKWMWSRETQMYSFLLVRMVLYGFFDKRCPTDQMNAPASPNVLLVVRSKHGRLELKSLSVNPVRPWQLAVGGADQYVRIYDWRSLSTGKLDRNLAAAVPMLKLAPPHMCLTGSRPGRHAGRWSMSNSTYVSFGNLGDKVVVTYHADHAYAFNTLRSAEDSAGAAFCGVGPAPYFEDRAPEKGSSFGSDPEFLVPVSPVPIVSQADDRGHPKPRRESLPEVAELAKNNGNRFLFEKKFSQAIASYSEAISHVPASAQLHALRSDALLNRKWQGDPWFALEDCNRALYLDLDNLKAHQRGVQALWMLGQLQAATKAAHEGISKFPTEERAFKIFLQNIEKDLADRQSVAQRNQMHRRSVLEHTRHLGGNNHDFMQQRRDNADPLAVRPVVPASALGSPVDSQQTSGARTSTSPPPPPPAGQPALSPPVVVPMRSAQGPRSSASVSEGEAMSMSEPGPRATVPHEDSGVEVSSGYGTLSAGSRLSRMPITPLSPPQPRPAVVSPPRLLSGPVFGEVAEHPLSLGLHYSRLDNRHTLGANSAPAPQYSSEEYDMGGVVAQSQAVHLQGSMSLGLHPGGSIRDQPPVWLADTQAVRITPLPSLHPMQRDMPESDSLYQEAPADLQNLYNVEEPVLAPSEGSEPSTTLLPRDIQLDARSEAAVLDRPTRMRTLSAIYRTEFESLNQRDQIGGNSDIGPEIARPDIPEVSSNGQHAVGASSVQAFPSGAIQSLAPGGDQGHGPESWPMARERLFQQMQGPDSIGMFGMPREHGHGGGTGDRLSPSLPLHRSIESERAGGRDRGAPQGHERAAEAPQANVALLGSVSMQLIVPPSHINRDLSLRDSDSDIMELGARMLRVGPITESDDGHDSDPSDMGDADEEEGWDREDRMSVSDREGDEKLHPMQSLILSAGPGRLAMLQRYIGHKNMNTDIKEAVFVGDDDQYVAAGSDCGHVFIYETKTGRVVRALDADDDVANCVQAHPLLPVLATSGIDNVVDLWSPEGSQNKVVADYPSILQLVERNQERMREGPNSLPVFHPGVLQVGAPSNSLGLGLLISPPIGTLVDGLAEGCLWVVPAWPAHDNAVSPLVSSVD
eukprot:jgi/Botrbrau1/9864/Bobra.0080s0001.1